MCLFLICFLSFLGCCCCCCCRPSWIFGFLCIQIAFFCLFIKNFLVALCLHTGIHFPLSFLFVFCLFHRSKSFFIYTHSHAMVLYFFLSLVYAFQLFRHSHTLSYHLIHCLSLSHRLLLSTLHTQVDPQVLLLIFICTFAIKFFSLSSSSSLSYHFPTPASRFLIHRVHFIPLCVFIFFNPLFPLSLS